MARFARLICSLVLLLLCLPLATTQAQMQTMTLEMQPESGPPGTVVTLKGNGAPPRATLNIIAAPFDEQLPCDAGRGGTVVAEVQADAEGRFEATHEAARIEEQQVGYTYLAKQFVEATPQPSSNLLCFRFQNDSSSRYFPETGFSVRGRFLEYWTQNGGLPVFGYPLSDIYYTVNESGDYVYVQHFERQRFERHINNEKPYDILLGRIGAEVLKAEPNAERGRVEQRPGCVYFEATGHNVCDQAPAQGFLTYWRTHGLDFGDPEVSEAESLALFGYPLTESFMTTNSSGDTVLTQYFERARLEWHPDNPDGFKVLGGLLGAELLTQEGIPQLFTQTKIALININMGEIGCGDSVVLVPKDITPTTAPLHAAMLEVINFSLEYDEENKLYNALHNSDLQLDSITIDENNHATIRLAGELVVGGACDAPRIEAQLITTADQFLNVNSMSIFINDRPLAEVLSER